MKKLLIILIVFIHNVIPIYANQSNDYSLDNFVCNYYETILEQTDYYISSELYYKALDVIEPLYNSKCRTDDVTKRYLLILYNLKKLQEAYVIARDNNFLDSDIGILIQSEMDILDKDSSLSSRSVYDNILIKGAYDKFSQLGVTQNYIYIGSPQSAIKNLNKLNKTEQTELLKAKAYFNMEMYEDSFNILKNIKQTDEVLKLQNEIKKRRAYQFVTGYELYVQKLNEEFKLDANKIGISNSCYAQNMQIYLDYVMHIYTSGVYAGQGPEPSNNVTNEVRLGTQGRLNKKLALRTDIGVKAFQDSVAMLLTDSWFKHYVNDDFSYKIGFRRNNTEQTFLSAVGLKIDNKFTGQVADNNIYLDATYRLPRRGYIFTKGGFGIKDGQNLPTNPYWEGLVGIGRILRYDFSKPYLQKISIDLVSYNSGYKRDLQQIYDSRGYLYGGYFSPDWYSDDTVNLHFSGQFKNTNLSYGLGIFSGWQFAQNPNQSFYIYGGSIYSKYKLNDNVRFDLQYRYYKYANVTRNQLVFDIVLSLFKPIAKK